MCLKLPRRQRKKKNNAQVNITIAKVYPFHTSILTHTHIQNGGYAKFFDLIISAVAVFSTLNLIYRKQFSRINGNRIITINDGKMKKKKLILRAKRFVIFFFRYINATIHKGNNNIHIRKSNNRRTINFSFHFDAFTILT